MFDEVCANCAVTLDSFELLDKSCAAVAWLFFSCVLSTWGASAADDTVCFATEFPSLFSTEVNLASPFFNNSAASFTTVAMSWPFAVVLSAVAWFVFISREPEGCVAVSWFTSEFLELSSVFLLDSAERFGCECFEVWWFDDLLSCIAWSRAGANVDSEPVWFSLPL